MGLRAWWGRLDERWDGWQWILFVEVEKVSQPRSMAMAAKPPTVGLERFSKVVA